MTKVKKLKDFMKENQETSSIESKINQTEKRISKIQGEIFDLTVTNVDRILDFKINMFKKDLQELQNSLTSLKNELQRLKDKEGKPIPGFED